MNAKRIIELARKISAGEQALDDLRTLLVRERDERLAPTIDVESLLDSDLPRVPSTPSTNADVAMPEAPPVGARKRAVRPFIRDVVADAIRARGDADITANTVSEAFPQLSRNSIHKLLSDFAYAGWLERVNVGTYRATEKFR